VSLVNSMPKKCQQSFFSGEGCTNDAVGIVVPDGSDPVAIYKESHGLCPRHGRLLLKALEGSRWYELPAVWKMVTTTTMQTSPGAPMPDITTETTPETETPTQETPMNTETATTIDTVVPPLMITIPVPTNGHTPEPVPAFHVKPTVSTAAAQLRAALAEKAALRAAMDAEIAAMEKAVAEAEAVDQWALLRTQIMGGGMEAIQAFDNALASGLLTRHQGSASPRRASTPKATTTTAGERQKADAHAYTDAMIQRAHDLKLKGFKDREIAETLNLFDSAGNPDTKAVYHVCARLWPKLVERRNNAVLTQ
jgi:hypothetical protein